ncbi:uncharacterized protein LOC143544735 [Bidens hawaiensis]|uniref:uncharacterized protein LOC143544735 n=1 Tax=Bidens hawaiensis TaxID=980011 RepID=UPI00404A276F
MSAPCPWNQIVSLNSNFLSLGIDLNKSFRNIVKDGRSTWFWLDWRLESGPLCVRFPSLFALEMNKTCVVADRLFMADGFICGNWNWSRSPTRESDVLELRQLLQICLQVHLENGVDRVVWVGGDSEDFSARSIKKLISARSNNDPGFVFEWSKYLLKKVGIVAWRAALGRLPTFDALEKRGISVSTRLCPICNELEESVDHLFVSCSMAQEMWSEVAQWCKVPPPLLFFFRDVLDLHKFTPMSSEKAKVVYAVCLVATWCLWKRRNLLVHDGGRIDIAGLVEEIKIMCFLWVKNKGRRNNLTWDKWRCFSFYRCRLLLARVLE